MDAGNTTPSQRGRSERQEREEFDKLFRKTYGRAYGLAYRMLRNPTEAEDAAQEAYLRAWRAFPSFEPSRPFEAWLMRILINIIHDWFRRRKCVGPMASLDSVSDAGRRTLHADPPDPAPGPEARLLEGSFSSELEAALSQLPESYRAAILLACVDERPYEEISVALDCPVGTVRSRVHRGREQLRRLLPPETFAGRSNKVVRRRSDSRRR